MRVTITVQNGLDEDSFSSDAEEVYMWQAGSIGPNIEDLIQSVADRAKRSVKTKPQQEGENQCLRSQQ